MYSFGNCSGKVGSCKVQRYKEGIQFAKKYNVADAYPTLLFLDKNQRCIGRVKGLFGRDEYFIAMRTAGKSEENKKKG